MMIYQSFRELPLFSSKSIIMLLIDPSSGVIIDANKGALDFYGYTKDDILKVNIHDINVLPHDEVQLEMERAKKERRNYFMFRHRKSNGAIVSVEVHSEPIKINDKEVLFSIIQDMTKHQKLMSNYVDVLQRYQTIFNHVGDMIILIKTDDAYHPQEIIEVNNRVLEVLKYSEEEILNQPIYKMVNAGTVEKFSRIGSELKQTGQSSFYSDVIDKYERKIPLYITTTLMHYSGESVIVAVARDLSVEFELQTDLDIQVNYYRSLFSKSPSGIFLIDENSRICDFNTSVVENFPFNSGQLMGRTIVEAIEQLNIEPEKINAVIEKGWKSKGTKEMIVGKKANQEASYVEVIMMPFELPDKSKKSYILLNDITNSIEGSQKINMLSAVFSNNNEGVLIMDADHRIEWVNHSFEKITGYSYHEAIGQKTNIMRSNKHNLKFYESIWEHVHQEGSWIGEIWNRKKTGEVYPVQLNLFATEDEVNHQQKFIGILSDIGMLKAQEQKILELIYLDSLTRLKNRSYFVNELKETIELTAANGETFSLIYMDLDNFKMINDTMGHSFGDEVLIRFSKYLSKIFDPIGVVGRIGGDEFTILIKDVSHEMIETYLKHFTDLLKEPLLINDKAIRLVYSAGIAQYPSNGKSAEALLKNADIAMYKAKEISGNSLKYYEDQYSWHMARELYIENLVFTGMENEEFYLEYQPIVSRQTKSIVGLEALVRWNTKENGVIPPLEFIPICEKNGTIKELGQWILTRSIKDILEINAKLKSELFISINVSPVQLLDKHFVKILSELLTDEGINPELVELEITETSYIENLEAMRKILSCIKSLGVRISIDDFGTGYSSFNQLVNLEVDKLKIDQSFLKEISVSYKYRNLVSSMLSMANNISLESVCEGIEFGDQLESMLEMQWTLGQGYLFSKPKSKAFLLDEFFVTNAALEKLLCEPQN